MLYNIIKNYLINTAEVDPEKFNQADLMVTDLQLDSLGLLEMLFEVEDKFGFQIPEPMRFLTMSFTEMVADIDAAVRAHHNGQMPELEVAQVSS
jgi:acyl carrier protein